MPLDTFEIDERMIGLLRRLYDLPAPYRHKFMLWMHHCLCSLEEGYASEMGLEDEKAVYCHVPECPDDAEFQGLCGYHHWRWIRYRDPTCNPWMYR